MSKYGYGQRVSKEALVAFRDELSRDGWRLIDISSYTNEARSLPEKIGDLSSLVLLKLLCTYSIEDLITAMGSDSEVLLGLDSEWDDLQRELQAELFLKALRGTQEEKAAAKKVESIAMKEGLAQIQYEIPREVIFGKSQVALLEGDELAPLVSLLGLDPLKEKIKRKTIELESADKKSREDEQRQSPSERIRVMAARLASTLSLAHGFLDALLARTPIGEAHTQLELLVAPFETLLANHPAKAKKTNP